MNNTKSVKELKQGILLGSFEQLGPQIVNSIQPQKVHHTLEIQNDLPANDQICQILSFKIQAHTHGVIEALEQYVTDIGTLQSIVLDNRGEFTSQAFKDFCQQNLITLYYTTPFHPQGNGIPE
ncbi:hypothetical protein E2C01_030619 [Portunus trituberculatus]|uniref:Integrase catalytic domain-containing protein n=1 Tax=Portunus trituberculatus TaxID=210409 RepID=A0A5B7EUQ2_PORTR|nr:hypothetical protein [Portunus trituberculatus]